MATSLFEIDGDRYLPTELSRGPWSGDALHGGPVAALLAHALEGAAERRRADGPAERRRADGPAAAPMFPARFTLELWRSVGFMPYRIDTEVVRPGRKVQVVEARLVAGEGDGEQVVARATLQQIAAEPVDLPDHVGPLQPPYEAPDPPEDREPTDTGFDAAAGHAIEPIRFDNEAVEHRATITSFTTAFGPATDWIRVVVDLLPGVALTPFDRVAAAADFGNGISATLPWDRFLFVNPDLTIHLFRLPADEWVHLDAATSFDLTPGAGGVAMAESVLSDRHGRIGRSIQSLYVAPV